MLEATHLHDRVETNIDTDIAKLSIQLLQDGGSLFECDRLGGFQKMDCFEFSGACHVFADEDFDNCDLS